MIITIEDLESSRVVGNMVSKYIDMKQFGDEEISLTYHTPVKEVFFYPGYFRDSSKNLYKFNEGSDILIFVSSEINPNGVGDGKIPEVARTYSIGFKLYPQKRPYRCKNEYRSEVGFYIYDRTLEGLETKFRDNLASLKSMLASWTRDYKKYAF